MCAADAVDAADAADAGESVVKSVPKQFLIMLCLRDCTFLQKLIQKSLLLKISC